MNSSITEPHIDPAAVFAAAVSLREACDEWAGKDASRSLSEAYNGYDELFREVLRIGELFETWACTHVAFDELGECWPYCLEDHFGRACLEVHAADALQQFDASACLRVAMELRLPVWVDERLPLPVNVRATNPITGSKFRELRIQTIRQCEADDDFEVLAPGDDPFDPGWSEPRYALYGVDENGWCEHIADRRTYSMAQELAGKLAPGIALPVQPVVTLAPLAGS